MCLWAHNKPKNAHRLELFCTALQYNPQALLCLDWPSGNVSSVPHFCLSDMPHAYLKIKMKKYQLNLKTI